MKCDIFPLRSIGHSTGGMDAQDNPPQGKRQYAVEADPNTMLLYVLRNQLGLHGPKLVRSFQCGACTIHLDGAVHSCVLPATAAEQVGSVDSRVRCNRRSSTNKPPMRLLHQRHDHDRAGAFG